jgi:hypothetical protein
LTGAGGTALVITFDGADTAPIAFVATTNAVEPLGQAASTLVVALDASRFVFPFWTHMSQ